MNHHKKEQIENLKTIKILQTTTKYTEYTEKSALRRFGVNWNFT